MLRALGERRPLLGRDVYVAETASVIGAVRLGDDVSVWPGAVLRADLDEIRIGRRTNIQDGAIIHVNTGLPATIGEAVTVAHGAILHGCTIGDRTLVGMGAVVLDGAEIGADCLAAAGSLVRENEVVPDGMLVAGNPARVVRPLTEQDRLMASVIVAEYVKLAAQYRAED